MRRRPRACFARRYGLRLRIRLLRRRQLDKPLHELVVRARADGVARGGVLGPGHPRVAQRHVQQVEHRELGRELEVQGVAEAHVHVQPGGERG